jgi:hypothetical protein
MTRASIVVVAALLLLVPGSEVAAQHPHVRQGFWIGFGLGYGSLGASDCDGCGREGGFTGVFRLGGKLSDRWLLGFESNAWIEEEFETTFSVSTSTATAYFYPNPASGLHLKGGLGVGYIDVEDVGDETGTGLLLGIGFDLRVGRNISIVPGASWFLADFDDGSLNLLQVGAGVTLH